VSCLHVTCGLCTHVGSTDAACMQYTCNAVMHSYVKLHAWVYVALCMHAWVPEVTQEWVTTWVHCVRSHEQYTAVQSSTLQH
jgi:hypothetical protein